MGLMPPGSHQHCLPGAVPGLALLPHLTSHYGGRAGWVGGQHKAGRDSLSGLDRHPVLPCLSFPSSEMEMMSSGDEPWVPSQSAWREVRVGCTEDRQLLGAAPPGAQLQGYRYCSSLVQPGSQGFTSYDSADCRQTPDEWP